MTEAPQIQIIGAALFALAVIHTFSTRFFERLAHKRPRHAGIWHLLGEVEVVFGFWAMVLMVVMFALSGRTAATTYLESRDFTEPMFVFAIMVMAGTRPILQLAASAVRWLARMMPLTPGAALYFLLMSVVPLLGSLITEPAAMTLAALMLRDTLMSGTASTRLKYATLGVLFVNISIGGTLTSFAAPPVLMVAGTWNWDTPFMMAEFGWRAALAVLVNAAVATMLFRQELSAIPGGADRHGADAGTAPDDKGRVPPAIMIVHMAFIAATVIFAHHPVIFIGLLLFFLGFVTAYERHQDALILREALLVAFFLGGLVVLGGQQQWWLQPALMGMEATPVFYAATLLTAITDNAALTYLGSLVQGVSDEFKVALVAGAVTGGGLTLIANAPNPAGAAILRGKFDEATISPLGLLLAAIPPTLVAVIAFRAF